MTIAFRSLFILFAHVIELPSPPLPSPLLPSSLPSFPPSSLPQLQKNEERQILELQKIEQECKVHLVREISAEVMKRELQMSREHAAVIMELKVEIGTLRGRQEVLQESSEKLSEQSKRQIQFQAGQLSANYAHSMHNDRVSGVVSHKSANNTHLCFVMPSPTLRCRCARQP